VSAAQAIAVADIRFSVQISGHQRNQRSPSGFSGFLARAEAKILLDNPAAIV